MSLEDAINKFAQEARRILIEKANKTTETTVVNAKGFNEDGIPEVKDLDLTKTVKSLGKKYAQNKSKLILDNAGSVERRKSTRRSEASELYSKTTRKKKNLPATPKLKSLNREGIFFHLDEVPFEELVTLSGWIYIYYSRRIAYLSANLSYSYTDSSYWQNPVSVSDTEDAFLSAPATYGKYYRFSVAYARAYTQRTYQKDNTASASASGPGVSASVSVQSDASNGVIVISDYDFEYKVEESNASATLSTQATIDYDAFGGIIGNADGIAYTYYYQFPNAKIYLHGLNEDGTDYIVTVDLNDYLDYPVFWFDPVRNFAKVIQTEEGGESTIVFHSYAITSIDMNDEVSTTDTDYSGNPRTNNFIGRAYKGILNLRTNLTTGATESKYTPSPTFDNTVTPSLSGGAWLIYVYHTSEHAAVYDAATYVRYDDYLDAPQAIWQNSFSDDWIYAWRNVTWNPPQGQGYWSDIRSFLRLSWTPPVWNNKLHGQAPTSTNYAFRVYYPELNGNQWADGQPQYNDYRDIIDLPPALFASIGNNVYNFLEDLPETDNFVQQVLGLDITGNPIDSYVPNYDAVLVYTDRLMDRIYETRLSYLGPAVQEEEEEEDSNP